MCIKMSLIIWGGGGLDGIERKTFFMNVVKQPKTFQNMALQPPPWNRYLVVKKVIKQTE